MNYSLPIRSVSGNVTLANIDGPDDRWVVAVVTGYQGCQDYDAVICELGTVENFTLTEAQAGRVLEALDPNPMTVMEALGAECANLRQIDENRRKALGIQPGEEGDL